MSFNNKIENIVPNSGTSGQYLKNNGVGSAPSWGTPENGLVFLYRTQANNSATVAFTNLSVANPYRMYLLCWRSVVPATNGTSLRLEMSNDNGATWITTQYQAGLIANAYDSTTTVNTNSTSAWLLSRNLSNAASQRFASGCAYMFLTEANYPYLSGHIDYYDDAGGKNYFGRIGGIGGGTGAGAFRFLMSSGNISSGFFYIYGIDEP
jgi:hypothetical protein